LERFTTNWALYDTMNSKNKQTHIDEEVIISKEMQKKLKLIKKAFC
jgi:hypothetical protein